MNTATRQASRRSIAHFVRAQGVTLARLAPSTLLVGLAAAAICPCVGVGFALSPAATALLEGLGLNAIYDFLKSFCERARGGKELDSGALQAKLAAELLAAWEQAQGETAALRSEVSTLIRSVEGVQVALDTAPDAIRRDLVQQFAELSTTFAEFRWLLHDLRADLEQIQASLAAQAVVGKETLDLMRQMYVRFNMYLHAAQEPASGPDLGAQPLDGEHTPPADVPCPYVGLQAFDEGDAELFFGRAALVAELTIRLASARFVAVVGRSGSGKSSLVRAGLLPNLRRDALPASSRWLLLEPLKPGAHPLDALAGRLAPHVGLPAPMILRRLQADDDALGELARSALGERPRLLVVVDQFEELFTSCEDAAERDRFIAHLCRATSAAESQVSVVVTLRDDHYSDCANSPELKAAVQDTTILVGAMGIHELIEVIEGPARKVGLRLESGLVGQILKDIGDAAGALPLLSHTLREAWGKRRGRTLLLSSYHETGGVQRALEQTANRVFARLSPDERRVAGNIALRLTNLGETAAQDSSRRVRRAELLMLRPDSPRTVDSVLQALVDARLVTTDAQTVEIAHEAVLQAWPALRQWLDEHRRERRIHQELTEAAQRWEAHGREPEHLYRGTLLTAALGLRADGDAREKADPGIGGDLNQLEREFLAASEQAWDEAVRRELEQARKLAEAEQLAREQAEEAARAATLAQRAAEAREDAERRAREQAEAAAQATTQRVKESNAARRRIGRIAAGLAGALVVALLAVGAALWSAAAAQRAEQMAQRNEQMAQQEQQRASTVRFALQTLRQPKEQTDLALLLGIEASRRGQQLPEPVPEVDLALLELQDFNPRLRAYLRGHEGWLRDVAFSPDGIRLATAGADGTVRLWNSTSGRLYQAPLRGHTGAVYSVAFHPDGWLASGDEQGAIHLWAADGTPLGEPLTGHAGAVRSLAFSPDGTWLAATSFDDTAYTTMLWDVQARASYLLTDALSFRAVSFSADSATLAAGGGRGVVLWDVAERKQLGEPLISGQNVFSVAFSPTDAAILAVGDDDGAVELWDTAERTRLDRKTEHISQVLDVSFSADGALLASSGENRKIVLWDIDKEARTFAMRDTPLEGHSSFAFAVAFDPQDPEVLASASADRTAIIWNLNGSPPITTWLTDHEGAVWTAAYNAATTLLASGGRDTHVVLWDPQASTKLHTFTEHQAQVYGVAFSHDSALLASGDISGTLIVRDVAARREKERYTVPDVRISEIAFSPRAPILAAAATQGKIVLWDIATGRKQTIEGHDKETVWNLAFTPDGTKLLTVGNDRTVQFWNPQTGEQLREPLADFTNQLRSIAISPDGGMLAVGTINAEIRLYDISDINTPRRLHAPLVRHEGDVWSLAFSPDGTTLASAGNDEQVILWNVATGTVISEISGHQDVINSLAYSADGKQLMTASSDDTIVLWSLDHDTFLNQACRLVGRNLTKAEVQRLLPGEPYAPRCLDPQVWAAHELALDGKTDAARTQFEAVAREASATSNALLNNTICWFGSLHGFPQEVIPACERAVAIAPPANLANFLDSYGVALAMTGKAEAAAANFQKYVDWAAESGNDGYQALAEKRLGWIAQLNAGQNPFTPELRRELLNE